MSRRLLLSLGLSGLIVLGLLFALAACTSPETAPSAPTAPGEGLQASISKVGIGADRKPVVTFTIKDAQGRPLKISDLDGYPSFIISYVKEDPASKLTRYVTYTVSDVKGTEFSLDGKKVQPALAEVKGRAAVDPKATTPAFPSDHPAFKDLGNGSYSYTFSTVLPADYDKNATHRVGGQITRASRAYVANPTLDFVPGGGQLTVTRQVVATDSCNQCHAPLAAHGGSRVETAFCQTCHTSQTVDPESGNSVDFLEMVHKLHNGANLPSVESGDPYYIVGYRNTVVDFSHAVLPQDVRNCTTCHGPPPGMKAEDYAKLAPNADNWKNAPSRAACGACHDQIDWTTGKSTIEGRNDHLGGPQTNDATCKSCHQADSGKEFDASVVGAHTIPGRSKQLKGVKVEIVRVTDTAPGQNPTVTFTLKDNAGAPVPISAVDAVTFNLAGPTTDYVNAPSTESAKLENVVDAGGGAYSYTLTRAIPASATGSYAIGMEVRRPETITGNKGEQLSVSNRSNNPVKYVPVTDSVAVPRRQIVTTEKCNVCHNEIAFHGGGRKNTTEYCQFCHNPAVVDVPERVPANFGGPYDVAPQSISFQLMIHRIHSGEELERDYTVYRTRGVFNFNEIVFPGDRSDCTTCHVGNSYTLPLADGLANTKAPRELYSPLGPTAAACLGCHDSGAASAHASTMTTPFGEACATCHGRGAEFDVARVHPGLQK